MNKLGIWGIAVAFIVGVIVSGSVAFAPPGQQGTPFQELWDAIFGLQTQVDDLDKRIKALETPPSPPPPPGPRVFVFVDGEAVVKFGAAQIVHVVVDDPNIDDTDEAKGEPDVTVNENLIRMVQGVDGKWHAFFADRFNALIADSGVTVPGTGMDFGVFCSQNSGLVLGPAIDVTTTEGFAIQDPALVTNEVDGNPTGTPLTNVCSDPVPTTTPNDFMAVLNGVVDINPNLPSEELDGQIGIRKGFWPFIQLLSFSVDDLVNVEYNVGGGTKTVNLVFVSLPLPEPPEHDVLIPAGTSVPGCQETNECYVPSSISINEGDTIIWFNDDIAVHTVTSGTPADGPDGLFDSSLILAGESFSVSFEGFESGQYDYFCMVHPWMTGEVLVT